MKRWSWIILFCVINSSLSAASHWDGSRTIPVHRLPIFDDQGQRIIPSEKFNAPMSQRNSCGSCHDYATITSGFHFNAGMIDQSGRAGEPWILTDSATGTQLPLSWRGNKGTWKPEQVGMNAWQFTKEFGRHLPGSGIAEPLDRFSPKTRWNVSGPLEANCLACHNHAPTQDSSEWARQISRENFRWAASAAAGLGDVSGMASRMRDTWTDERRANPDDHVYAVPPSVTYQASLFDNKNQVVMDIGRPLDRNCLACHSVSHGAEHSAVDGDVHTRAGMSCVDCHRNGLDHQIVRGYEGEAHDRPATAAVSTSCKECHVGTGPGAGRFGAHKPEHRGLPPLHLEKMSCTACHSGATATTAGLATARTSRANRIGIHGRAIWDTDLPRISEPVFAPGHDGKISPHRALWPAFWAKMNGDSVEPLLPEVVSAIAGDALQPSQQIAKVLVMLAAIPDAPGIPALGFGNRVLHVSNDLELTATTALGVPTGNACWGFIKDEQFIPLVPADGVVNDATKTLIEFTLKVLCNAGITDPLLRVGQQRYRINVYTGDITAEAAGDTPMLARLVNNQAVALVRDLDQSAAIALDLADHITTIMPAQISLVLKALSEHEPSSHFAYIANGQLHRLAADGSIQTSAHHAAEPTLWPVAHDVRPARQALGANGCQECHATNSPFLTASVLPNGPLSGGGIAQPMAVMAGLDPTYHQVLAQTFQLRTLFKTSIFIIAGGLALALLLMLIRSTASTPPSGAACCVRSLRRVVVLTWISLAILAATGFVPFLIHVPLSGWTLLIHNGIGAVFSFAVMLMALFALRVPALSRLHSILRGVVFASGCVVIVSAALMMIPWQGTDGQYLLMIIHRIAGLLAVVSGLALSTTYRLLTHT